MTLTYFLYHLCIISLYDCIISFAMSILLCLLIVYYSNYIMFCILYKFSSVRICRTPYVVRICVVLLSNSLCLSPLEPLFLSQNPPKDRRSFCTKFYSHQKDKVYYDIAVFL